MTQEQLNKIQTEAEEYHTFGKNCSEFDRYIIEAQREAYIAARTKGMEELERLMGDAYDAGKRRGKCEYDPFLRCKIFDPNAEGYPDKQTFITNKLAEL